MDNVSRDICMHVLPSPAVIKGDVILDEMVVCSVTV